LTFYYCDDFFLSFLRLENLRREVEIGIYLRELHCVFVNIFFLLVYFHILRGMFFFRLKYFLLWFSGWVLFVLFIGVAFLGYVLPWGQISFWGAAVITNFLSVVPYVGNNLVFWVWGDLIVSGFTLKFFYTAHFLLPLFCRVFILAHLILLHFFSSSGVLFSSNLSFKCSFFFLSSWLKILLLGCFCC